MKENNVVQQPEKYISLKCLTDNWLIIVMVTVLCALIGLLCATLFVQPTYTATKRVMFVMKVDAEHNTAGSDMILSKTYLHDATEKIKSPLFIAEANEIYQGEDKVEASAISAKYVEESLIFSLSYTDVTEEKAVQKLDATIESAKTMFLNPYITVAKDSTLKEVENRTSVSKNGGSIKYVLIGGVFGAFIAVLGVLAVSTLDNTVKDKSEFEALTGVYVLSYIEDMAQIEDRKSKNKVYPKTI